MSEITSKKNSDWHREQIKAAVRETGWSLRQVSIEHGLGPQTLNRVLDHPYPRAERIVADWITSKSERFIGKGLVVQPWDIWPSRYENNLPNRKRGPMRGSVRRRLAVANTQASEAA